MEQVFSSSTFDAMRTPTSITLQGKTGGLRKTGILFLALGLVLTVLGFLPLIIMHYNPLAALGALHYLFYLRWIGIIVAFAGLMILVRSIIASNQRVVIDHMLKVVEIKHQSIPFSEIKSLTLNNQAMMGKNMVSVILTNTAGKKKVIIGTLVSEEQMPAFQKLISDLDAQVTKA